MQGAAGPYEPSSRGESSAPIAKVGRKPKVLTGSSGDRSLDNGGHPTRSGHSTRPRDERRLGNGARPRLPLPSLGANYRNRVTPTCRQTHRPSVAEIGLARRLRPDESRRTMPRTNAASRAKKPVVVTLAASEAGEFEPPRSLSKPNGLANRSQSDATSVSDQSLRVSAASNAHRPGVRGRTRGSACQFDPH